MAVNEWWNVDLRIQTQFEIDEWKEEVKKTRNATLLLQAFQRKLVELRNAVRAHRDTKGDDRCWLDDVELYKMLPETTEADFTLPPREEFLASCERYCEKRQPQKSIDKKCIYCNSTETEMRNGSTYVCEKCWNTPRPR